MDALVVGDNLRYVRFLITDDGAPVDLTGATLEAKFRINGGSLKTVTLSIVAPATAGLAEFQPGATDFDVPGTAIGRIFITSIGKTGKSAKFVLPVEAE